MKETKLMLKNPILGARLFLPPLDVLAEMLKTLFTSLLEQRAHPLPELSELDVMRPLPTSLSSHSVDTDFTPFLP